MRHTTGRLYPGLPRLRTTAALTAALTATLGAILTAGPAAAQDTEGPRSHATGLRLSSERPQLELTATRAEHPDGPAIDRASEVTLSKLGSATGVRASAGGDKTGAVTAEAGLKFLELEVGSTVLELGTLTAECSAGPTGPTGPTGADATDDTADAADGAVTGDASLGSTSLMLRAGPPLVFASDPEPNTTITLPDGIGEVVLNEQTEQPDGSLTVTAFRLSLTDDTSLELSAGSVTCLPGEAPDGKETAALRPSAAAAGSGDPVAGVVFEAVRADGGVTGTCVTDAAGGCTAGPLEPGRAWVCVADVPEGYRLPPAKERCYGPFDLAAGDEREVRKVFELEPDPAGGRATAVRRAG
jgi:hypothetical protein